MSLAFAYQYIKCLTSLVLLNNVNEDVLYV